MQTKPGFEIARTKNGKRVHWIVLHSEGATLLCRPKTGWAHKFVLTTQAVNCKRCRQKMGVNYGS